MSNFARAWDWRERRGLLLENGALRIFHGAGEGQGDEKFFAVDRFSNHYWITEWESKVPAARLLTIRQKIIQFLKDRGALSIVGLTRPDQNKNSHHAQIFFVSPLNLKQTALKPPFKPDAELDQNSIPEKDSVGNGRHRIMVQEGPCRFWIQLEQTRHPGLFLDHAPLRDWLYKSVRGLSVLKTFAYTGSLSVAAALGGAEKITTLDLSQPTLQWAKDNMELNQIDLARLKFIHGDTFEWLPRLKKAQERFDCVILDPPSFSHGRRGLFSTQKDMPKLHSLALDLVKDGGFLISSINSANISWKKYQLDITQAAQKLGVDLLVIRQITLPETFPTLLADDSTRYLKGWIFQKMVR